jgi:dihydropteroate synthase
VDTTKPAVAEAALEAGAAIVNDIGASRTDEKLWRIVAGTRAGYVAMHMLGEPRTMQASPVYADVVGEVRQFFADRLARLEKAGVSAEQVVLDVGIGFGKTVEHNLQLLAGLRSFTTMGRPVLLGVSRKSFIGKLSGTAGASRLGGSLAATVLALESGVSVFRAHDVADTVQALRTAEAILARKQK